MEYVTAPWVNYEDFRLWMRKSFLLFRKLLIQTQVSLHLRLISAFTKKVFELVWNTGSCAAAASKAAAVMLLSGEETDTIKLDTPKGITLTLDVLDILRGPGFARCAIRKDSGDDPDDTNGTLIYATVSSLHAGIPEEELVMQPRHRWNSWTTGLRYGEASVSGR